MWLSGSYRVVGQSQGPLSLGQRALDHRGARQRIKSTVMRSADLSFHGQGPRSRRLVENNYQRERTHIINAPDNELHT
jgi:hypothetical protein